MFGLYFVFLGLRQQEVRRFPQVEQTDGAVRVPNVGRRDYSRKKPKEKSHLKSESVGSEVPLADTCGITSVFHLWF